MIDEEKDEAIERVRFANDPLVPVVVIREHLIRYIMAMDSVVGKDVLDIANKLGLVPPVVVGYGTIDEAINFVKNGFISHFGDAPAEGLVLRPMVDLFDRKGQRIITKIKTVDFK